MCSHVITYYAIYYSFITTNNRLLTVSSIRKRVIHFIFSKIIVIIDNLIIKQCIRPTYLFNSRYLL